MFTELMDMYFTVENWGFNNRLDTDEQKILRTRNRSDKVIENEAERQRFEKYKKYGDRNVKV